MIKARRRVFGLLAFILITGLPFFFQGCALFNNGPVDTAARVEEVTIPSVNGVMSGWAEWVKAGHATQSQVDAVKAAYNQYFAAQLKASNAFSIYLGSVSNVNARMNLDLANASVDASKGALLNLITTYKK